MTNSLIPYSFVPGTKAMASEVNANFIALANSVEEGKQYTNKEIEKLNTSLEERLDEYKGDVDSTLNDKIAFNMSNSVNISNCILQIPQNIIVELNAGTLTLKAGSVLTVPDGLEEDETTPKFTYYTVENDVSVSATGVGGTFADLYCCYNITEDDFGSFRTIHNEALSGSALGATPTGHAYWYDSSANLVKYVSNNVVQEGKYSLPLFLLRNSGATIIGVEQVFNGYGFIGSTAWVDKGVKCLFADGRNPDGTLKNFEFTQEKITFSDLTGEASIMGILMYNETTKRMQISGFGVNSYFSQRYQPVSFGTYALWFNSFDNVFRHTRDGGANWEKSYMIVLPFLIKNGAGANISSVSRVFPINLSPFEGDRLQALAPDFDRAYSIPCNTTLQATENLWANACQGNNSQYWAYIGSRADNLMLWQNTQDSSNGAGTAAVSMFVPRGYFYNIYVIGGSARAYPCKGGY